MSKNNNTYQSMGMREIRFGNLCLVMRLLTPGNLEQALIKQEHLINQGSQVLIGDLLVETGMISSTEHHQALRVQKMIQSAFLSPESF